MARRISLAFALWLAAGCGASAAPSSAPSDLGSSNDLAAAIDLGASVDLSPIVDAGDTDGALPACSPPSTLSRGVLWARQNGFMISGLSVAMGAPPAATVDAYFDDFHANTAHLWSNGLPTEVAGWSAAGHAGFRYVSWLEADGTSVENAMPLGGIAPLPGRVGYQIGDEPADTAALSSILSGVHAARTMDPDALTIVNFGDNAAAGLPASAAADAEVDVLSYDKYSYKKDQLKLMSTVREAALAHGKAYWRYTRAYYQKGGSSESTASDLRWDVYAGALYGYTGLSWFVYQIEPHNPDLQPLCFSTAGDYSSTASSAFSTVAALNAELARLAPTLGLLRSTDVRYVAALALLQPSGTTPWQKNAGNDPYLAGVSPALGTIRDAMLGFFRDDCGDVYVMLQNASRPGAEFPNATDQAATFHVAFDFTGAVSSVDRAKLMSIDPATGALTTVALTGTGDQRSVDLTIPAGAIVFWKYDNGRPFVGR